MFYFFELRGSHDQDDVRVGEHGRDFVRDLRTGQLGSEWLRHRSNHRILFPAFQVEIETRWNRIAWPTLKSFNSLNIEFPTFNSYLSPPKPSLINLMEEMYSSKGSGCRLSRQSDHLRGLQFESSHRQNFNMTFLLFTVVKTKIKKKRPVMVHLKICTLTKCCVKAIDRVLLIGLEWPDC